MQYGIQEGCQNWKILKFFNYDFTRITMAVEFFSGSMRPALWVFILKMNALLDILKDPRGNLWVNFLSMEPF